MINVKLGLEKVLESPDDVLEGRGVGLICNQASVCHNYVYSADHFHNDDRIDLKVLFGPQHGIRGDVQDNMVETGHTVDPITGIKVYSLYSETREPTAEMLEGVDVLVYDLQDIGGRVYTFVYTMANAMRACARLGKKFVVLDRPNPIGGNQVEGSLLEVGHESFVGQFPIPMRHGMTSGELSKLFNEHFGIGCDLDVIPMSGWKRNSYMDETTAPWAIPSPNMPTIDTAVVFPGTVFFEGTELSEGRGTTRPFEIIGAPYIDADNYSKQLNKQGLRGVYFRAVNFTPTFQKYAGQVCGGVFIHVTDRDDFRPVATGIAAVKTAFELYEDQFQWKQGAYEYEFERNPFDVIAGNKKLRAAVTSGMSISEITASWAGDEAEFEAVRSNYLLYE